MGKKLPGAHHAKSLAGPAETPQERPEPQPWPAWGGEIELSVGEAQDEPETKEAAAKTATISRLATLLGLILVALTAYAMWTGNEPLLGDILGMVQIGLIYVAVWAGGGSILYVLSKLRIDE